jgi:hypothetical protein
MIPHVISPLITRNDITWCTRTMTIQLTPVKQITKVIVKLPIKLQMQEAPRSNIDKTKWLNDS